ncbi:hypothetical protein [Desulfosarcina widdelii]|nr:hypothetical protein [Desulfosarcina widdelii]
MEKIQAFIDAWTDDEPGMKPVFVSLFQTLQNKAQADIEFHERPGISYSLRGLRSDRNKRPLFVMVDVIDDNPGQRWLSVCFYGEMIQDPDELGDLIPEGLLGEDGYCFDISEADNQLVSYVSQRIEEAYSYSE